MGGGGLVSNAQRKNNKATTIGQKLCIFSPVNRVFLHTHQYEEMKNNLIICVMMCIYEVFKISGSIFRYF